MGEAAAKFGCSGIIVTVGTDGLLLDWGPFMARKFVPYRRLLGAVEEPLGIRLDMNEGRPLFFYADMWSKDRVVARIEDASAAWNRAGDTPFAPMLSRSN